MTSSRTQVAIIGAGPAGLLLSHLLDARGVKSVVLETRTRHSVETTVRAGVLEQNTVDLLNATGLGERMRREGAVHHGINLRFDRRTHRIDLHALTGRSVTVYAQHQVLRDLIEAAVAAERPVLFESSEVKIHGVDTDAPRVTYTHNGEQHELACDFVAGCDGFHGISRGCFPKDRIKTYSRDYGIGWLGILVNAAPSCDELIYARHDRGFALVSTRSPTLQRMYVQCDPRDPLDDWPDERIWGELATRLECDEPWELVRGPIVQKNIVAMRSFVAEPMRFGRLFLAGDAAHIVPPTGAKGLNLAVADVAVLAPALIRYFETGKGELIDEYSSICLPRIWRGQRFSTWMTQTMHKLPGTDEYQNKMQVAELDLVGRSTAAATSLAENYVGFPLPAVATDGLRSPKLTTAV